MNYLILCSCVALGTLTSIISRIIKKSSGKLFIASATNTATFFVAMLTVFLIALFSFKGPISFKISSNSVFLALLYGICVMFAQFSFLLAVGRGPVSISTLFYSCGFIIPTFYGILRLKEEANVIQIIGVGLIIIAFILSTRKQKEQNKFDFIWLIFALGGMVFSGGIGIVQKEFSLVSDCSVNVFIFYSFAFAFILNLILTVILFAFDKDKKISVDKKEINKTFANALILGAIMGVANKLNTYIAGVFPSVKTFPIVNGGRIILTTVLSALIFKEKTGIKQKIGIIIGFIAIALIAYK